MSVILDSRRLQLRPDQARAVEMSTGTHPIFAIQAAYGTGKTVIGAFIAARLSVPGELVIATATTNVAIAQFIETLLRLDEFSHLPILRFVADSALQEGVPRTPVDLHTTLQSLLSRYFNRLHPQEIRRMRRYTRGRRLLEQLLFHPEQLSRLSEEEREEYRIAEMCNSEATERAIAILLRLQFPAVLCITTSSLLNSTREGGLFHELLSSCRTIIADEASQIPEPVFVAMVTRFPQACHIYIGDVHQLQPHLRCPRSALAARLGGRGVMSLLLSRNIPLAPLVTTFRAHPALVHLSNTLVYDGTLESGTPAHRRNDLILRLSLPNPRVPFVLVNDQCCRDIIRGLLSRDVPSSSIGVITFYKEQQHRLQEYTDRLGVALYTVDSVQGREMDVAIILTTRTDVDEASGNFLNDIQRMNVALTRCKYGQFVLGYLNALHTLSNWSQLVAWAARRNTIVETVDLPDIFS
uniref:AAA_12 domain-containing protein n=1 Tax=Haemonchus contortus TaxID=6289 RepID=A0A7I4YXQ2_HAECO